MRTGLRRLSMGLATLAGWPKGFFAPYRYAGSVKPARYPELEEIFLRAEPRFRGVLSDIETHRSRLAGFDGPPPVPRWGQSWFPRLDGAAAYAIVRRARPARIIEVGSGHSTRMIAQAVADAQRDNEAGGGAEEGTSFICIDPAPRARLAGLEVELRQRVLSDQDIALFRDLSAGDIAFFDSSHLLWPGTDVDMILNRILPVLAPGVLVHVHDITLPDPYPESWTWRGYGEQTGLGGWISGQGAALVFSSHYALTRMNGAEAVRGLPLMAGALETSLWFERR
ncbi:MAG: class I SAM-dependent methyltransferase [Pseudomonadota bacterium]